MEEASAKEKLFKLAFHFVELLFLLEE